MKLKFGYKGIKSHYGVIGYLDFTVSIFRRWNAHGETWRHIVICLRSPVLLQPGSLFKDGKRRFKWYPLRFGYLASNYYFGIVYLITSFKSAYYLDRNPYQVYGPVQWVWDDGRYRPKGS